MAFVMESRSEAGVAPYGEHVVIRPSWHFFGQYFIEPVFAGYCRGGVRLNWSSNQALVIQCRAERIVKQAQEADGVRIEYVITQ